MGAPTSQIWPQRADESGGEKTPELSKASSGEGEFQGWPGEMYKEWASQGGGGCDQRGLKRRKREPKLGAGRKGSGRGGLGGEGSWETLPGRAGRGARGGGGVPAVWRARAGRAAVTSRPGPLPLAGWVGPRRAERARGQGGGRGGAGLNVSV